VARTYCLWQLSLEPDEPAFNHRYEWHRLQEALIKDRVSITTAKNPDRGHPVRQRAKHAPNFLNESLGTLFALRAQADKMSAIRF
jgi:hypothetical protein